MSDPMEDLRVIRVLADNTPPSGYGAVLEEIGDICNAALAAAPPEPHGADADDGFVLPLDFCDNDDGTALACTLVWLERAAEAWEGDDARQLRPARAAAYRRLAARLRVPEAGAREAVAWQVRLGPEYPWLVCTHATEAEARAYLASRRVTAGSARPLYAGAEQSAATDIGGLAPWLRDAIAVAESETASWPQWKRDLANDDLPPAPTQREGTTDMDEPGNPTLVQDAIRHPERYVTDRVPVEYPDDHRCEVGVPAPEAQPEASADGSRPRPEPGQQRRHTEAPPGGASTPPWWRHRCSPGSSWRRDS